MEYSLFGVMANWADCLHRRQRDHLLVHLLTLMLGVGILQDIHPHGVWTSAQSWVDHTLYTGSPTIRITEPGNMRSFQGGVDPSVDSFKEILIDGDIMLVGSKNALYQIDLAAENLDIKQTIQWEPSDRDHCTRLGKNKDQCHNYIRVISRKTDNEFLLCGTNAYKPWCRTYRETEDGYELAADETGIGLCPFDHMHNSTAVYADGRLYSGTVADLSSRDSLIYRKPMRTEQHDSQWLNDPDFVNSFEYEDKVYFLFRETAIEYINCGKAIYSRVGRVCKNDKGGNLVLRNAWTSFFKARLNCSIPGEFPFYFDEIQSTTRLGKGNYHSTLAVDDTHNMIYAVFNTPRNSISGSAVCAFKMSDIKKSFDGAFKAQKAAHSNWLPVRETSPPHPAKQCHNNTQQIPDTTLTFIKNHPLMDEAVPAFGGQPILIQSSFNFRMTQIAVDWQYGAVDGRRYDILYLGTDDGRVIKAVNKNRSNKIETVVIEDIVVFPDRSPIVKLEIYRRRRGQFSEHLVVVAKNEIRTLPLHRCHLQQSCGSCVGLQDPYCSWDTNDKRCINLIGPNNMDSGYFFQNIELGKHSSCEGSSSATQSTRENRLTMPQVENDDSNVDNEIPVVPRDPKDPGFGASIGDSRSCSGEKIAIAVIVPSLVFSIIGFFVGFVVSRRHCRDKPNHQHTYEENHKKSENTYSQEPANKYVTSPPFPQQGGKVKIYHNPTKQCNLKVPNGSVEAIVEPHKDNKVYV